MRKIYMWVFVKKLPKISGLQTYVIDNVCKILSLYSLFHLSIYTFMLNFRNVSFKEFIMFIFVSKVLYISDRMSKIHVFFFNTIHKNKLKMD